ncbi:MAG: hypothetical protein ACYC96_03875 [Fimbriimonadaceae bacterium]
MPRLTKRALSLALLWLLLGRLSFSEAFGRFGFLTQLDLAGMRVDRAGIIAKTPHSDVIAFAKPSREWKATITSEVGQTVELDKAPNTPRKVAANLYAPGAALFFDGNLELHLKTKKAPFLTWQEGSVAVGVPTPRLPWVLVSFDGQSAPFLISLPPGTVGAFSLSGAAGDWSLTMAGPFSGWAHVAFPFGIHEYATSTAADLGQLAARFAQVSQFYLAPTPALESLDVVTDKDGVTATWTFSRPAVVPPAVIMAPVGGYGIKVRTAYSHTGYATEAGPIAYTAGRVLRVRFPCKTIGPGRAIAIPGPIRTMPATVSAIDVPSVVDLAVEAMRGDRDPACQAMADDATQTYLSGADFAMELWTRETVPYNVANKGLDLSAAYALLTQALELSNMNPPANPFLKSVFWRTDWLTWMPFSDIPDLDSNRRAAALTVVASAMSGVPGDRLAGAMLEAGLAAERGLSILHSGADTQAPPPLLEPLYTIRHELCGTLVPGKAAPQNCDMLLTAVRVLSPHRVAAQIDEHGLALKFNAANVKPLRLVLELPKGTDVSAGDNVTTVVAKPGPSYTFIVVIKPRAAGPCSLRVTPLPRQGPRVADLPPYSEARL